MADTWRKNGNRLRSQYESNNLLFCSRWGIRTSIVEFLLSLHGLANNQYAFDMFSGLYGEI